MLKVFMNRILLLCVLSLFTFSFLSGQLYKTMMDDIRFNINDVKKEAASYFEKYGTAKGSGYADYQRWLNKNERLFYPTGDRSRYDPYQSTKAYEAIKKATAGNRNMTSLWQDLGPYSADSVTTHYAPGIGRVECVWVDPDNENLIYLSSRSGGFWRSNDGGLNWLNTTDVLPITGVNTFAVNPGNNNDIIINLQGPINNTTHGVYRSMDGGLTWNITIFNPTNNNIGGFGKNDKVYEIKFNPINNDTIYIGTSLGLYVSNNNLSSVAQVTNQSTINIAFHPTNHNIVYRTREYYWNRNDFYRSTNGGFDWTLTNTITANNYAYPVVAVSAASPNTVFFASSNGIWKSLDSGLTFNLIPNTNQYGWYFGVADDDANKFLKGGLDVYRSSDGGNTFVQSANWYWPNATSNNYVHADLRYVYSVNGNFYVGTDGYLAKSTDYGITWSIISNGTGIRENYCLGICQSDIDRISCGSQDNGSSFYKDGQWVEWVGADGMEQIIHPLTSDWAISNIQNGGKNRTKDGALSIMGINGHASDTMAWVTPLAFNPNSFNTIYSMGNKLYRSLDFGTTWTTLHNFGGGPYDNINEFAIAENNSNIMLASRGSSLFKSTNGGYSFNSIASPTSRFIEDIALDPNNDNTMIVVHGYYANEGRIYVSHDGGNSFQNITYNLGSIPVYCVVIDHSADRNIYVGTEKGVYVKSMSETMYTYYSNGLPPLGVLELEINYGANKLFAATWGRGLWANSLRNRENYPIIKDITMQQVGANGIIHTVSNRITVTLENATNITQAYVKYQVNSTQMNQTINMSRLNQNQWYFTLNQTGAVGDSIYYKVFLVTNTSDTTSSYRMMYKVISVPPYCTAGGTAGTGSDYIDRVMVNAQQNVSGKAIYTYFSNVNFNVSQFSTNTIKIRLNFAFSLDKAGAWIDWNGSGTFEPNESIVMGNFANNESTGTFSVPNEVLPGSYRLRTRNSYNAALSPCGNVAGEVEDYTVIVNAACASDPIVSNLNDNFDGSLRFWIQHVCANDTVFISQDLLNQKLELFTGALDSKKAITIVGHNSSPFEISGRNQFQIFQVSDLLNLVNLRLSNGYAPTNGGAIYSTSNLTLRNCIFNDNFEGTVRKTITCLNDISILSGLTVVTP